MNQREFLSELAKICKDIIPNFVYCHLNSDTVMEGSDSFNESHVVKLYRKNGYVIEVECKHFKGELSIGKLTRIKQKLIDENIHTGRREPLDELAGTSETSEKC